MDMVSSMPEKSRTTFLKRSRPESTRFACNRDTKFPFPYLAATAHAMGLGTVNRDAVPRFSYRSAIRFTAGTGNPVAFRAGEQS